MNNRARILSALAAAATAGSAFAALSAAPAAFAGGKSANECSTPYRPWTFDQIDLFTAPLIGAGKPFPSVDYLNDNVLTPLDHNGNHVLCQKIPSGWSEPNNGANRQWYLNLVDDKIVKS